MAATLTARGFRLFDYTQFAEPLRDEVRGAVEWLAVESGHAIEYVQRKNFRKEDRAQEVLRQRGDARPGWWRFPVGRERPGDRSNAGYRLSYMNRSRLSVACRRGVSPWRARG